MKKLSFLLPALAVVLSFVLISFTPQKQGDKKEIVTETYYYILSSTDPADENNRENWVQSTSTSCSSPGNVLCSIVAPEGTDGHPMFDFDVNETVRNSEEIQSIVFKP